MAELELRDHWRATAPNWRESPLRLAWHVVLDEHPALGELAAALAPGLRAAGFDPVPPRWLHLTVTDVSTPVVPLLDELEPIAVRLGPPRLWETAVVLEAEPADELLALRAALGDDEPFRPHVSLAYAGPEADPSSLSLPDTVVEARAETVSLLRLRRRERGYRWDVLDRVRLGPSG